MYLFSEMTFLILNLFPRVLRHLSCYVTQIPNYVPMYFQKISQFSFHSVIDVHILRAMICSSNYVYDWFYMCSKLFLIGKWYISICLSIIAFKPYVIGFPIIMQYCNAMILEVCFERKIIQVSQKLLNM